MSDGWYGGGDPGSGWVPPPGAPAPYPQQQGAPPYGYAPFVPQPSGKRFGWGSIVLAFLLGGLVSAIVTVGGLFLIGSNLPDNVAGTHQPIEEGTQAVRVGDCLEKTPGRAQVSTRDQVVDCDELHGSEVIGVVDAPDAASYPGEGTWAEFVDGVCPIAFLGYVGADDDDVLIEWRAVVPSVDAWEAGDRSVFCLADSTDHAGGSESVRGVGGD